MTIFIYILTFIFVILSLYIIRVIYAQMTFLSYYYKHSNKEEIFTENEDLKELNKNYSSFRDFENTVKIVVRFFLKKVVARINFVKHYLSLIFIKFISFVISIFDKYYHNRIDEFLNRSIENKTYVKYFWKNLKQFKKEIAEKEDK